MNSPINPLEDNEVIKNYGKFLEPLIFGILRQISILVAPLTSLIVIVLVLFNHLKSNSTSLDYIELILVIGAFLIILIAIILISLENRWKSNTKIKMIELYVNQKKLEMEFKLRMEELNYKMKDI